jgi:ribosomal protein S27E
MKIIDFKNPDLHRAFEIKRKKGYCSHNSIIVDEHQRMVECSACGARIDPFDFLWHTANNEGRWYDHASELKKKVESLHLIKERLEKDVKNLESKIKRRTDDK